MADTEVLFELPALGPLFARALLPRPSGPAAVPERAVMLAGYRQDAGRLARYVRVCGLTLRDSPPPTWLHVLTFPLHVHLLSGPGSTLRIAGMVHVSNRMRQHRQVSVTEPLDLLVRASDLRPHRRGAVVDLRAEARVAQELVWEGLSTYLVQGVTVPGEVREEPRQPFVPATPAALWWLDAGLGRRYRAVSGDPNPIHSSLLAARAFGYRRPIIHGMWTHARVLAALENRLPAAYTTSVWFTRPILLPSTVGYHALARDGGWDAAVTAPDGSKPYLLAAIDS